MFMEDLDLNNKGIKKNLYIKVKKKYFIYLV